MRNPPWLREEAILALDLYFNSGCKVLDKSRREVVELAATLNRLRGLMITDGPQNVRSAGSVAAKLANFRALDPSSESAGFSNVARVDVEVWKELSNNPRLLADTARRIHSSLNKDAGHR